MKTETFMSVFFGKCTVPSGTLICILIFINKKFFISEKTFDMVNINRKLYNMVKL
jgi:hypothetical protein